MESNSKKVLLAAGVLVVLLAVFAGAYTMFRPQGNTSEKTITVEIIKADETSEAITIITKEEFLRGALEQARLIERTESEYGLYVTTVRGITADEKKNEWWCFTKDGEELFTGVESTPTADGDHFEITLKTW